MEKQIRKGTHGKLYLMRGLPGSGKSHIAKRITRNVFSTDTYFMKNGKYKFDFTKIQVAHEWNKARVRRALETYTPKVVVDNTNTSNWEMTDYARMGVEFDYNIFLVEPDVSYKWDIDELLKKTKHNVSREKMELMLECYDHDPSLEDILKAEKE